MEPEPTADPEGTPPTETPVADPPAPAAQPETETDGTPELTSEQRFEEGGYNEADLGAHLSPRRPTGSFRKGKAFR